MHRLHCILLQVWALVTDVSVAAGMYRLGSRLNPPPPGTLDSMQSFSEACMKYSISRLVMFYNDSRATWTVLEYSYSKALILGLALWTILDISNFDLKGVVEHSEEVNALNVWVCTSTSSILWLCNIWHAKSIFIKHMHVLVVSQKRPL